MTTSSSATRRGLDAAPIVYSLLSRHPASAACEHHIRSHTGWLTTSVTLLEAGAVLRKVYGVDPGLAAQKLTQFAAGPITVLPVDAVLATTALSAAAHCGSTWPMPLFSKLAGCAGLRSSARTTPS